jgi:hypothetical protein
VKIHYSLTWSNKQVSFHTNMSITYIKYGQLIIPVPGLGFCTRNSP